MDHDSSQRVQSWEAQPRLPAQSYFMEYDLSNCNSTSVSKGLMR